MTTDPRARRLAEARQRITRQNFSSADWDQLQPDQQGLFLSEATVWLNAAVEAGLMPPAARPTPEHDAVLLDNHGHIWGEYQTSPPSHGDAILPLVWASEECSSKRALEEQGIEFRLIGWSQ